MIFKSMKCMLSLPNILFTEFPFSQTKSRYENGIQAKNPLEVITKFFHQWLDKLSLMGP
jgi:hypothetical protein